jgi:predicted site-specific integrase-resolvase
MGIKVSASQAAQLVGRNERIVRGWISAGKVKAEKGPDGKWRIDTDDLQLVIHVDEPHRESIRRYVEQSRLSSSRGLSHDPQMAIAQLAELVEELRKELLNEREQRQKLQSWLDIETNRVHHNFETLQGDLDSLREDFRQASIPVHRAPNGNA